MKSQPTNTHKVWRLTWLLEHTQSCVYIKPSSLSLFNLWAPRGQHSTHLQVEVKGWVPMLGRGFLKESAKVRRPWQTQVGVCQRLVGWGRPTIRLLASPRKVCRVAGPYAGAGRMVQFKWGGASGVPRAPKLCRFKKKKKKYIYIYI